MLTLGPASGSAATMLRRRTPAFSPLSLAPLALYDMSDLASLAQDAAGTLPVGSDGDPVGFVADLSGNGHHLTASGAARPAYRSAGGRHGLESAGSLLQVATRFGLGANPALTVVAALTPGAISSAWEAVWQLGTETATGTLIGAFRDSGIGFLHANGNQLFQTPAADADRVVTWRRSAAASHGAQELFLDGMKQAAISGANPANTPVDTGAGFRLFDRIIGGQPMAGQLQALAVFGADLADSDVTRVAAWMAAKQGRIIPQETHVFALMGQSNMVGQAPEDGGASWPAETRQYNQAGALVVADGALDHYSASSGGGAASIGLGFARAYAAANPQARVLLVPCAAGGTGFADGQWRPGDPLYGQTVARLNAVMALEPGLQLRGFLWHQGERDAMLNAASAYQAHLSDMVTGLRNDVSVATAETPFVCGGLLPSFTLNEVPQIQSILADAPNVLSHCGYASSVGATTALDDRHFDAAALRLLGAEYYQAYLAAVAG